ncbi:hypothetical protein [Flavobacterium sp.]|uniref:hypothetical protein n=1 Tax=Flavobacterium sp. TaxID=239 RepID=UPI0026365DA0|nr:hypothetical protein [Flavobacterium sp.]
MTFIQKTTLLLSLLFLTSCENFYSSSIVNNSNAEIIVKVKRDQKAIEEKRKEYIQKGYRVDKEIAEDYEVKIARSESYELAGRLHIKPDFYDIKEIEIYSQDTLILKCKKDQMQKLFSKESSPGNFDLIIN